MTSKIILLDGGMGQELVRRSSQPASPLWSAKVLLDEPHLVEAVHNDYIEAGAKVLTLNLYSSTPERLARDASEELFEPLQRKAIEVATRAIGDQDVTIGGCIPPLFGSYHPEKAPDYETCLAAYRRIVAQQKDAVDVFLLETLSSVKEVKSAVTAAVESGKPVWCGMSVSDQDGTKLRSGENLSDGANAAKEAGATAVLINCSWPEAVTQGLPDLEATGLAYGGYANGFTNAAALSVGGTVDHLGVRTDLDPKAYAKHAFEWIDHGATIIGGCCEVGPAHIKEIAEQLVAAGHEITGNL